jgi:HEPN domain-containing protein
MNSLALEWVNKAEGDYSVAIREFRVRKNPNYDAVCYHSQQMAEKYLKAILQENDKPIPRTHSLMDLLSNCLSFSPTFEIMHADLSQMEGYAVQFRYPGLSAEKIDAQRSIKCARIVREFIRMKMELD